MARRTFPRRDAVHAVTASHVLAKHERATGTSVELPVPIELIIEQTYGLEILWDTIREPPGVTILGALAPSERRIMLNVEHQHVFERWIGPERFTLAHELAHWVYDADNPDQLTLGFDAGGSEQFCYHRGSPGLSEDLRIREVNANKLAAHLLLPEHLVRAAGIDEVLGDFRAAAARWQVCQTALRIRLSDLGLIDDLDVTQLELP